MKKFVILLFVAMAALSAKAQVYVGGTVYGTMTTLTQQLLR